MVGEASIIGFGEAGQAFAWGGVRAFDRKTLEAETRGEKLAEYAAASVDGRETAAEALAGARVVLSLVTADQALAIAETCAPLLTPGTLWLDMNSVAPATKRKAAALIEKAGGRYVDVAIMAPVLPQRRRTPLLTAGPHGRIAAAVLEEAGFSNVGIAGAAIGSASAVKLVRSVMIKGLEALGAECIMAAEASGVREAVLASLDASWKPQGWSERIDHDLGRMIVHGKRRAAEMDEAASMLAALGIEPIMTRATVRRQRLIGDMAPAPERGIEAKLASLKRCSEQPL